MPTVNILLQTRLKCKHATHQGASVAFVNTSPPKYSLEPLVGDDWETRRAKQVIRAVVRAKNEIKVTTEELARRCSELTGREVKTATLNGIFAGKRKAVSLSDLEAFSQALIVPLTDLLYPPGEEIEVRPDIFMSAADALTSSLTRGPFDLPALRTSRLLLFKQTTWRLERATEAALDALMAPADAEPSPEVKSRLEILRFAIFEFQKEYYGIEADNDSPTLSKRVSWALDAYPLEVVTARYVENLRPLFHTEAGDGERQAEA